jgi:hypothetical protein
VPPTHRQVVGHSPTTIRLSPLMTSGTRGKIKTASPSGRRLLPRRSSVRRYFSRSTSVAKIGFAAKAPYVSIAGCQTPFPKSFLMFDKDGTDITPTVQRDFVASKLKCDDNRRRPKPPVCAGPLDQFQQCNAASMGTRGLLHVLSNHAHQGRVLP